VTSVLALIPAHNEEHDVGSTVCALRDLPAVNHIVVIDDGSIDGTTSAARRAGARVFRASTRHGKGRALDRVLDRVEPADVYLLADADLGDSARGLSPVLAEVLEGRADLAVAILPAAPGGGFGLVKRAARGAIRRLSGFEPVEPLSGQRAVTAGCLLACRPLAPGFGLETAMTIDAVRAGFRVVEVPTDVHHRATGRTAAGFIHRGKQGLDIARAVARRALVDR